MHDDVCSKLKPLTLLYFTISQDVWARILTMTKTNMMPEYCSTYIFSLTTIFFIRIISTIVAPVTNKMLPNTTSVFAGESVRSTGCLS